MSKVKKLYDTLLNNGYLQEVYSNMVGVWEKDKSSFTKQFLDNEALINNSEEVLDLDDEEFNEDYF